MAIFWQKMAIFGILKEVIVIILLLGRQGDTTQGGEGGSVQTQGCNTVAGIKTDVTGL